MAVSPYDLEQNFEHELNVLEGEIDELLSKLSINKGGTLTLPPPKNFKPEHMEILFSRYLAVGWSSVKIANKRDSFYLEFKY